MLTSGDTFYGTLVAQLARRQPDTIVTKEPGLVIVQIDGLAQPILAQQVRAGRVPFISHWIRSGEMTPRQVDGAAALADLGQPGGHPARQQQLHPGVPLVGEGRPADARLEPSRRRDGDRAPCLERRRTAVERRRQRRQPGLGRCRAQLHHDGHDQGSRRRVWARAVRGTAFFVSPDKYLRAVRADDRRGHQGVLPGDPLPTGAASNPSMHRGMPYPIARAATNVILRSLATSLVMEEMYRGTPVIYVDYTDYDEIAHHSGPERSETLDALDGVDSTVRSLVKATEDTPRPYKFVLLGRPRPESWRHVRQRYGKTLQEHIAELMGGVKDVTAATSPVEEWGPLNAVATEASHASGATGAMTRAALRGRTEDGAIDLAPAERRRQGDGGEPASRQSWSCAPAATWR